MFLAAGLVVLPAANVEDRLLSPERRAGLRQIPAREKNPRIVRFGNRQQLSARFAFRPMLQRHRAEDDFRSAILFEKLHLR